MPSQAKAIHPEPVRCGRTLWHGTAHYAPFVSSWCVGVGEGESTMDVAGGGRSVENIHQFRRADSLLLSMFADGMMLKACTHPHPHPSLPLRPSLSRTLSHSHAHSRPPSSHRHSSRLLALCRMHRPSERVRLRPCPYPRQLRPRWHCTVLRVRHGRQAHARGSPDSVVGVVQSGPFRPSGTAEAMRFIKDLLDGYFPYGSWHAAWSMYPAA
jgi:hypothetical protein